MNLDRFLLSLVIKKDKSDKIYHCSGSLTKNCQSPINGVIQVIECEKEGKGC